MNNKNQTSQFGQQLKLWRNKRGLSQIELAAIASTTPRHLSFIESGRSRPGRDIILRLSRSLDLPPRHQNSLLVAAGLPPQFAEREPTDPKVSPYWKAIEQILQRHNPFPACVFDGVGRVLMCNEAHRRLAPDCENQTPEESMDAWFAPGSNRENIENWTEIAWGWVDRMRIEQARTHRKDLAALVDKAMTYLKDVARPSVPPDGYPEVIAPRFRFGDQVVRTFGTIMRFESAMEVTLSELKVELLFPEDEASEAFFHKLANEALVLE